VDLSKLAVLVGSVTQSDPLLPARNPYTDVTFSLDEVDGRRRVLLKNARLDVRHLTNPDADEGLESVHGRLFAVPVAPGTYELTGISLWFQSRVEALLSDPPRVTVAAGEVLYIGNLTVRNCYSTHIGPDGERVRQTVVGGFPEVADRSARDLPLLRATYPSLGAAPIKLRVLDGAKVSAQARDPLSRGCSFERDHSG